MKMQLLVVMLLCQGTLLVAWSGAEVSGEKPVFFGKLTSQEGRTFNVTNVTIGRNRDAGRVVRLYEMPRVADGSTGKQTVMIPGNPHHDLTTTELDLLKVKKIVVPHSQTSWIWEKPSAESRAPSTRYEFIELEVTWKGDQTNSYLLELGTEHTTNPMKLFCDSTGNAIMPTTPSETTPMFCAGINQAELRKKGAPFPSVKELIVEGYCYQAPANSGTLGIVKPKDEPIAAPLPEAVPVSMPEPEPAAVQSTPDVDTQIPQEEVEIELEEVSEMPENVASAA